LGHHRLLGVARGDARACRRCPRGRPLQQFITTKPTQATTYRGGTEILAENAIPSGRVEVVPADGTNPGVDVGDVFSGATVGPVDYSQFGGYLIAATTLVSAQHNHLAP
jgi:hypothetical protein